MLFTIVGIHIEITDAIREHAREKAEKLPRFYDNITQIEVVIEGNEGGNPGVEVLVRAEHQDIFVARESGPDAYTCLDIVIHKLERQLKKAKEKQRDKKRIPPVEQ